MHTLYWYPHQVLNATGAPGIRMVANHKSHSLPAQIMRKSFPFLTSYVSISRFRDWLGQRLERLSHMHS